MTYKGLYFIIMSRSAMSYAIMFEPLRVREQSEALSEIYILKS